MDRRFWSCPTLVLGLALLTSCAVDPQTTEPAGSNEGPGVQPALAVRANSWTTRAPMPTPRAYPAAAVANNSVGQPVLYAIGGFDPGAGRVRSVEAYNFATDRWTARAPLPIALSNTNGVGNIGGKLYISGGFLETAAGVDGRSRRLYVYDPVRNSWARKADMPRKIAEGITGVIDGKLYVLTGSCEGCADPITRRLYRYDPATDTWETSFPWCPHAHVAGAGAVINGKFYVAGGRGRDNRDTDKLDVYNPVTNRWTTLARMREPRTGVAAARLQNKLYVIGESNITPGTGERQNDVDAYDPVTNTWKIKAPMPTGRGDLAAARVTWAGQSHILAVGGFDIEGSTPGDVNQAYTP